MEGETQGGNQSALLGSSITPRVGYRCSVRGKEKRWEKKKPVKGNLRPLGTKKQQRGGPPKKEKVNQNTLPNFYRGTKNTGSSPPEKENQHGGRQTPRQNKTIPENGRSTSLRASEDRRSFSASCPRKEKKTKKETRGKNEGKWRFFRPSVGGLKS